MMFSRTIFTMTDSRFLGSMFRFKITLSLQEIKKMFGYNSYIYKQLILKTSRNVYSWRRILTFHIYVTGFIVSIYYI